MTRVKKRVDKLEKIMKLKYDYPEIIMLVYNNKVITLFHNNKVIDFNSEIELWKYIELVHPFTNYKIFTLKL